MGYGGGAPIGNRVCIAMFAWKNYYGLLQCRRTERCTVNKSLGKYRLYSNGKQAVVRTYNRPAYNDQTHSLGGYHRGEAMTGATCKQLRMF